MVDDNIDDIDPYATAASSRWGGILRVVLYVFLAAAALGMFAALQFRGLRSAPAMEHAVVARSLASGDGFTTPCIRPLDLWYLQQRDKSFDQPPASVPELRQSPAYPFLLSLVFRVTHPDFEVPRGRRMFDAEYKAVVPLGIMLTLLCGGVLYLLGTRLLGPRVAGIAAIIYLVSVPTLNGAISGLPVPFLSLVITLACLFALTAVRLSATGADLWKLLASLLGCAVCVGLAVLGDFTMVGACLALVVLLALQLQRLRWGGVLLILLVAVLMVGPWLLHHRSQGMGAFGARPYTALQNSQLFKADSLARSMAPEFNVYRVGRAVRAKAFTSVFSTLSSQAFLQAGVIICFFVLALIHRYDDPRVTMLKWFVPLAAVVLAVAAPLFGPGYSVMGALFPLLVLVGTSAFCDYVDREEFFDQNLPTLLRWALVLVCAIPALAQIAGRSPSAYPPYYAPMQRLVGGMVEDGEWLCTDIPWATAWYGGTPSVLLPQAVTDVSRLPGGWDGVGGVYLTSETSRRPYPVDQDWQELFFGTSTEEFPFRDAIVLPPGHPEQVFLSDRPRWEPKPTSDSAQ